MILFLRALMFNEKTKRLVAPEAEPHGMEKEANGDIHLEFASNRVTGGNQGRPTERRRNGAATMGNAR